MRKVDVSLTTIKRLYFNEGKSQDEIAKELGVSQWVVCKRLRDAGLKARDRSAAGSHRLYDRNELALDELTPKTAWVIGWFVSDGFIETGRDAIGMRVSISDLDILEKLKKFFNYTGPIYFYETKLKKTGKLYKGARLKISSLALVEALGKYGIHRNKTTREVFPKPILETDNEEIIKNFIKGVFEGDGSVLFDEVSNSLLFQVVGTKELLLSIQRQLMRFLGVGKTKLTRNISTTNHYALRYRGRYNAMQILDWIYKDSSFHLDRKYNKYLAIKSFLECST